MEEMIQQAIITLIGAAIGTLFTMWLFKAQENIRIKEDFRLEFFKKYNSLYIELFEELNDLYERIQHNNQIIDSKNYRKSYLIKDPIINSDGKQSWSIFHPKSMLEKQIELSKSIKHKKEKMRKYIENNKIIYKKEIELYEEIYIGINDVFIKFNTISTAYDIIDADDNLGLLSETKIEQQKQHNEIINEVLNLDKQLNSIINNMQLIHEKIEKEFIGKYFEEESSTNYN